MTDATARARSPRIAQILCIVAGVLPLVAAILFSTDRALTLDPIRPVNLHPEPYGVEGVPAFTPDVLRRTLEGHGFSAELRHASGSTPPVGLFFARKSRVAAAHFPI